MINTGKKKPKEFSLLNQDKSFSELYEMKLFIYDPLNAPLFS